MFFCPFWRFLEAFSGYFQAKNTFFRGHFAFLNGMKEKQKGKNDEKSKEKAVGRGTDIFSDSFHSTLKKPSFFRRKASSWRCSECICRRKGERKIRSHLALSKWCYIKFAHEFCENHLPSFVKKRQVFFIASTWIRKNIGFSQINIKASHNDEKLWQNTTPVWARPPTKSTNVLTARQNIHTAPSPSHSQRQPAAMAALDPQTATGKTPKAFKDFLRATHTNSAQTSKNMESLSGIYYRIL